MVNENSGYSILEYLQKNGSTNTFKLAHVLEIKRDKLLRILKNLEEQELVKIVTGKVEFLSYPFSKEKKKIKPKVVVSKKKSDVQTLQEKVEEQKLEIGGLKNKIKKLEQRPPKVITRTIIKKAKPKVITRTIIKEAKPKKFTLPKPIKTERKKQRKRKKVKEIKIKPKKNIKRSVKLRKKFKKVSGVKKSLRKLGLKIKGGAGIFKIKKFIKHLKRR